MPQSIVYSKRYRNSSFSKLLRKIGGEGVKSSSGVAGSEIFFSVKNKSCSTKLIFLLNTVLHLKKFVLTYDLKFFSLCIPGEVFSLELKSFA